MSKKITFVKNYTRDTTLIIQEMWFKKLGEIIEENLKNDCLIHFPVIGIDYINDGVIEIWENEHAINFIIDKLIKKSFEKTDNLLKKLINFEQEVEKLKLLWSKPYFETKAELLVFINRVETLMAEDIIILYLGSDDRVEKSIKEKAEKLRSVDTFFASNDLLIRKSLAHLFPEYFPYTTYIRQTEFNGGVTISQLKERYNKFIIDSNGHFDSTTFVDFKNKNRDYIFKDEILNSSDKNILVSGQVGNSGFVFGKVFILKRIDQIKDVPVGVIIVSPMTTPALVSGLKHALAIVTDEGGMLCHAAVISRELNIPSVIGTKNATKIFKNGDKVEVDANKGIVKKM
ncbi:MAG: hypothetical protein A2537_02400 [Candidatus Magasanikbacteria bacterium RIFOXYD2_FULL_36_9]|uniref:PEP-utilising enzyme mobile domain-containing protein n=1 Tax=Candidatus Magasanikbacteria bacterium RIFOXYD2_FULL_36_9 TaxID=1798707 RepID=A0A1F6P266_9BACT|nr:MAG: hypothetical protein A2537_02400 [Candidatus Magasanikbacteria bacterium RIFOXYD2_FULL_36_9]